MAALAADVNVETVGKTTEVPLSANGADTFYQGGLVFIDTAGGAQNTWAAGDRCAGVALTQQTTTAAGDEISVCVDGCVWLPVGTNIAAADEGDTLVVDASGTTTDNPADTVSATDATLVIGDVHVGRIIRVTSTQMLVKLDGFGISTALGAV